jgi:hypothetical protein
MIAGMAVTIVGSEDVGASRSRMIEVIQDPLAPQYQDAKRPEYPPAPSDLEVLTLNRGTRSILGDKSFVGVLIAEPKKKFNVYAEFFGRRILI